MSAITLSAPARKSARVRLVYKITTGIAGGRERARDMADDITDAWTASGTAFVVRGASDPVQGGSPGAGAFGILANLWGLNDWGTAIEVKTKVDLPSITWQQLVSPLRAIGFSDLYVQAEFVSAELLEPGQATAASPAAQQEAAQRVADRSQADDVGSKVLAALTGILPWIIIIVAGAIGFAIYRKTRQ